MLSVYTQCRVRCRVALWYSSSMRFASAVYSTEQTSHEVRSLQSCTDAVFSVLECRM